MTVTALAEDWSGQLWIGTTHGVATLKDGRLVRHETDGFPTAHILSIGVTRDGSIWIGTRGNGLLRYRSGQFRTYNAADGLPSANINAIYEDSHGTLWIGTLDHGVGRFRDEHFDFSSDAIGILTLAGTAGQIGSADGTSSSAQFFGPSNVAVDSLETPAVDVRDSERVEIHRLRFARPTEGTPAIWLENVAGAFVHACDVGAAGPGFEWCRQEQSRAVSFGANNVPAPPVKKG